MPNMKDAPTEASFKLVLETFETSFTKCLDAMLAVKSGKLSDGANEEQFQNFQPRLYDALLKLSREYQRLRIVRESLIERKGHLSATWFRRRQRTLAERQEALKRAIRAGRTLGDAFIWFFYRNDPELLNQHITQPFPSLPPTGVGGEGELALVDGVRKFGDKYILFHGISSLFRLGDASLFDFKRQRIVGIGELKTLKISKNQFNLHFVASMQRDVSLGVGTEPTVPVTKTIDRRLTAKQDRRLKQQLATISRAASAAERPPERRLELQMRQMGHPSELDSLVQRSTVGRFAYQQLGSGLLVAVYGLRKRNLASKLCGQQKAITPEALSEFPEKVKSLLLPGSPHNCIILNHVFYGPDWEPVLMPGTTPFLWWPLDVAVLRDMALGHRVVITVYNPAHLFVELQRRGFVVERFKPPTDFALSFQDGSRKMTFENVAYFLRLVSVSLLSEAYVVDLLWKCVEEFRGFGRDRTRVDLQFTHAMF